MHQGYSRHLHSEVKSNPDAPDLRARLSNDPPDQKPAERKSWDFRKRNHGCGAPVLRYPSRATRIRIAECNRALPGSEYFWQEASVGSSSSLRWRSGRARTSLEWHWRPQGNETWEAKSAAE